MANRRLGVCPTCRRKLDDATRRAMGLRNGEVLNALCPGLNGPSDIDHVLHNMHVRPERLMFLEYKDGVDLSMGQQYLRRSLVGNWAERDTGRLLSIRYEVLQQHEPDPPAVLREIVSRVWPAHAEALRRAARETAYAQAAPG